MFDAFPTYRRFRPLLLLTPRLTGEDVYAFQTALKAYGFDPGPLDGVLGSGTANCIRMAQKKMEILADGIAGQNTQTTLVRRLSPALNEKYGLPVGLLFGHIALESGCWLGIYSEQRSDGSFDAGVAQRNTAHTPAMEGFNVPKSMDALAANERKYFDLFVGIAKERRRWELAAGSWNAPAYACYIAKQEGATKVPANQTAAPSQNARDTLERYMQLTTTYLELSP